jgi:4-amino-4-deoxychorismate lyase
MFWYDGKLINSETLELAIDNPGLIYGATVFTTLRVYQKSLHHPLTHWQSHCDRLSHSLQEFGWKFPDWQRLRQGAGQLLTHYPILRIVIFPDGREWISGRYLPADLDNRQQQGIIGWIAAAPLYRRSLASYKTGNYLGAWLARQQAQKYGANEAILIDEMGNWLETSTGNLWGWKEGCWWTPILDERILPGIVRSQLLNWLHSQNIPVRENNWTPDFVRNLEAIAYSNCGIEIVPFSEIISANNSLILNPVHPALSELCYYFSSSSVQLENDRRRD